MSGSERAPDAASELFERYRASLLRYLVRFTGEGEAAEDVVQETFVRLLERPPRGAPSASWLFRVATNLARDAGRTRRRRHLLLLRAGDRVPHGDEPPRADAQLEAKRRRTRVAAALQELSPKERMALLMREEGFLQREIAEAVGTTTKSVGTLTVRAIRKLAARLEEERGEAS